MKNKVRCLIVDDEELAIRVIESYIAKVEALELAGSCQNAFDAFNVLNKEEIDVIFLDIKMPQLSGLEFIRTLNHPPKIIMTTAFREYAHEGFELDVLDYLLKPIAFSRFLKAVGKVTRTLEPPGEKSPVKREENYENASIFVKCGKTMEKICYKDVIYIESFRDNVKIHTTQKTVSTYLKISYLEENLPKELFLRIHKSFMISIAKIGAFSSGEIEVEGVSLPVGNFYKKQVMDRLNQEGELL